MRRTGIPRGIPRIDGEQANACAKGESGVSSKISGIDGAQIASVGAGRPVQRSQDAVSGGASADTSNDGSQNVQITGTARQLADLEQKVRDLPAINEERVSQLRVAIEQGTYTVRPQHVADQLLSLERALGKLPGADEPGTSGE
jgi:negative regulator of flagellin synthesis FlgM